MDENKEIPAHVRRLVGDVEQLVRPYQHLADKLRADAEASQPPPREVIAERQEQDDLPDLKTILVEAIREAGGEPTLKKAPAESKPTTVNDCMAAMLLEDPTRVGWSARKWAEVVSGKLKRKVSASAVKQTNTWKKQIIPGRALMRADKATRNEIMSDDKATRDALTRADKTSRSR